MTAKPYLQAHIYPLALGLLPEHMDSSEARAMLTAIGLQESRFEHRRQMGDGPARGWWQFERGGGVYGVLTHTQTKPYLRPLLPQLGYSDEPYAVWTAIEHNDVLAVILARLLLWTHRQPLPGPDETDRAWTYYLDLWRPGKPHRATWDAFYAEAWRDER